MLYNAMWISITEEFASQFLKKKRTKKRKKKRNGLSPMNLMIRFSKAWHQCILITMLVVPLLLVHGYHENIIPIDMSIIP